MLELTSQKIKNLWDTWVYTVSVKVSVIVSAMVSVKVL